MEGDFERLDFFSYFLMVNNNLWIGLKFNHLDSFGTVSVLEGRFQTAQFFLKYLWID